MSDIYVQEPPCEGKVCFETTVGEIDIELWSRECPKACRNFIQLCLEGYYDKTKFFRVVPDFIVQGGDPTNTGHGGESVWGKPFKDEFHSRLRFVRRGLVAMANSGKDDNGSQFFFTLAPTRELQNKHTIFGKVVGDTIYNMIRLSEGHLEDGERPKYPHKIIRTRVLINPFTDITPRETIQQEVEQSSKKSKPQSKMKATKDFKLLSFGEEAEDEEEDLNSVVKKKGKGKSAHDHDDPNLLANADKEQLGVRDDGDSDEDGERRNQELNSVKEKLLKRKAEKEMTDIRTKLKKTDVVEDFLKEQKKENQDDDELDYEYECPIQKEKDRRREEIQKEFKALQKELKPKKQKEIKESVPEEEKISEEEKKNDMLLSYHKEQKKYKEKTKGNVPKKKASREDATLAMLAKFKQKLEKINDDDEDKKEKNNDEAEDEDDEDLTGDSWMKNTLRFESNDPVLAKDASTKDDDWFDIYDPRNPLNQRRREKDRVDGLKKEKDRRKMAL